MGTKAVSSPQETPQALAEGPGLGSLAPPAVGHVSSVPLFPESTGASELWLVFEVLFVSKLGLDLKPFWMDWLEKLCGSVPWPLEREER